MLAKKFKLYIDESGDFKTNDRNQHQNPSLVGGVLFEEGTISEWEASKLLVNVFGTERVHLTEHKNAVTVEQTLQFLRRMQEKKMAFVIFENRERLHIVDPDFTYLNILAEGITKLKTRLTAKYGEIELELVIASRVLTEKMKEMLEQGYSRDEALRVKIPLDDYKKRFFERMYMSVARGILHPSHIDNIHVKMDSAYRNPLLMFSDIVCNVYITRTAPMRYTVEQRAEIVEIYRDSYYFSFVDTPNEKIHELLIKNRIDEAIFTALLEDVDLERFVTDHLKNYGEKELAHAFDQIAYRLDELISIQFNYDVTNKILARAYEKLIPLMKTHEIYIDTTFELDVLLFQYTISTHVGGERQHQMDVEIEAALAEIKDLPIRMSYYIKYQNRKAMLMKNNYLYEEALLILDETIAVVEDFVELMKLIPIGESSESLKYEELGKLYGSKGLILSAMHYKNNGDFQEVFALFQLARSQFTVSDDIARHTMNLATTHIRLGEVEAGLKLLLGIQVQNTLQPKDINKQLREWMDKPAPNVFNMQTFMFGLNQAQLNGHELLVRQLEEALQRAGFNLAQYDASFEQGNFAAKAYITWHYASFLLAQGKTSAASQAIQLTQKYFETTNQNILHLMQLGVMAQRILIERATKRNVKMEKQFHERLQHRMTMWQAEGQQHLMAYFGLPKLNQQDVPSDDLQVFIKVLWGI